MRVSTHSSDRVRCYACRFGEMCVHVCLLMVPADVIEVRARVRARVCMNVCYKNIEKARTFSLYIHLT